MLAGGTGLAMTGRLIHHRQPARLLSTGHAGVLRLPPGLCGHSTMDSAPVSEAGDLGSIPSARTTRLRPGKPGLRRGTAPTCLAAARGAKAEVTHGGTKAGSSLWKVQRRRTFHTANKSPCGLQPSPSLWLTGRMAGSLQLSSVALAKEDLTRTLTGTILISAL